MGLVGIEINVFLGALNLLPIPPLDGSRVLTGLLPDRFGDLMRRIEPFGLLILLLLLFSGVLWHILLPVINLLLQIFHFPIYSVFGY
jgi:Zn-dependent protease